MTSPPTLLNRLLRSGEARVVIAFSLANLMFALVGNRVLTELAAPNDLGTFYMYMNVAQWIAIPGMGAYHLVFRYWLSAKYHAASASFFRMLAVGVGAELLLMGLAVAVLSATGKVTSTDVLLGIGLTGVALASGQAVAPVPASERKRAVVGLMGFASTPLRYFVLAGGVGLMGLRAGSEMIWVQAGYSALVAACAWRIFASSVDWSHRAGIRVVLGHGAAREILRFSGPYVVSAILMQVCATAERWGLARLDNPAATAVFVLSVGLSTAGANAVSAPLLMYFQPLITEAASKMDADGVVRHLRRLTIATTALMTVGAALAYVVAPVAAALLFGKEFGAIAGVLPWTAVGACAFALGQALAMYPYAARDSLGPNVAHGGALAIYAAVLFLYRPTEAHALAFARVNAAAYIGYAGVMALVALRWSRRFARFGAGSWDLASSNPTA